MRVGKNIYFSPNEKYRKFSFEKIINGKRISRKFRTKEEAQQFSQKFANIVHEHGVGSLLFSAEDKAVLERIRQICGDFDPIEAVKFWRDHYSGTPARAPDLESCWIEFLSWLEKAGRSDRHISSIKTARNRFLRNFAGRRLEQIRRQELLDWLLGERDLSARSKKNLWTNTRNFLSWCQSAKSWIVEVPKIDDRLLPKSTQTPVEIWTFREIEKVFRWLEKNEPEYVPHYALRAFAGLRTAEASQMCWEWIDFANKRITVPAHVCKTRDAWVLLPEFLPDTVFHWLAPWKKKSGEIKKPHDKARRRISRACKWKQNVLRHTFATMHVAMFHDEGKTILATRHTNIATLRSNYRGVNQTQSDAKKFFELRPLPVNKKARRKH